MYKKVGLGGGCHWCTEAVFASLKGVQTTEQGWIASQLPYDAFSEAVIVTYNPTIISLKDLIHIHLHTHSSTSHHSMRDKYRSVVYWFDAEDKREIMSMLTELQSDFEQPIITQVLPFADFRLSLPEHLNYYYSNKEKPFCKLYINPKIQMLRKKFSMLTNDDKMFI